MSDELAIARHAGAVQCTAKRDISLGAPASTREVEALLRDVRQHPQQRQLWLDVKAGLFSTDWQMGALGHRVAVADAQLHLGNAVGSPTRAGS